MDSSRSQDACDERAAGRASALATRKSAFGTPPRDGFADARRATLGHRSWTGSMPITRLRGARAPAQHETAVTGPHVDDNILVLAGERLELVVLERERLLSGSYARAGAQNRSSAAAPPWSSSSSRACRTTSSSADCCTDSSIIASVRSSSWTSSSRRPDSARPRARASRTPGTGRPALRRTARRAAAPRRGARAAPEHVLDARPAALARAARAPPVSWSRSSSSISGRAASSTASAFECSTSTSIRPASRSSDTGGASTRSPSRPRAGPPTIRRWNGWLLEVAHQRVARVLEVVVLLLLDAALIAGLGPAALVVLAEDLVVDLLDLPEAHRESRGRCARRAGLRAPRTSARAARGAPAARRAGSGRSPPGSGRCGAA